MFVHKVVRGTVLVSPFFEKVVTRTVPLTTFDTKTHKIKKTVDRIRSGSYPLWKDS